MIHWSKRHTVGVGLIGIFVLSIIYQNEQIHMPRYRDITDAWCREGMVAPRPLTTPPPLLCLSAGGGWGASHSHCTCKECYFPDWAAVLPTLPQNGGNMSRKGAYSGYRHYIHTPRVACPGSRILIIVMSAVTNFRERHLIRGTWGSKGDLSRAGAALVFLLGDFQGEEVQGRVDMEARVHGDILQGSFQEDYHRLALKSMSGLHWVEHHCPGVPWVTKTDDDTVIDMGRLEGLLGQGEEEAGKEGERAGIACHLKTGDPVVRPGSGMPKKWEVTAEEFPNSTYPDYCFGVFYLMPRGVGAKLLQAFIARGERIFKLDDVFMTGILAKEAGITHRQISPMVTSVPIAAFEGTLPKGGGFHHALGGLKERYWMWRRIQMARALEASNAG